MKFEWDLTLIYKNNEEWEQDYKLLENKIEKLSNNKDFIKDMYSFEDYIDQKIKCDMLIEKVYCFPKRHLDINSNLKEYKIMLDNALILHEKIQTINNFFETTVLLNSQKIIEYIKTKRLNKYKRYLKLILRRKDHIIFDESELKKSLKYKRKEQDIKTDYQNIFSNIIDFKNIEIDGKKVNINQNTYNNLILNKDQNNRKKIYDTYTKSYEEINEQISKLYIDKLKNDISLVKSENYGSLLEKKLFELELSNETVQNLIDSVNNNLTIMNEYCDLKKKMLNLKDFHIYDSSLSICEIPKIDIKIEEAITLVKKSLSVLGSEYIKLIENMFKEGWIDVYPKDNKRKMSFTCISYIGVPYILLNYDKSLNSVRTLAHEIGHAVHTYYSKSNNEYEYFEFSYFLAEIASKVNEILFNEYIYNNSKSMEEKKYVLNNIISSLCNSIFGQSMLTEFENNVIDKIHNNQEVNSQELNNLYTDLSKKYNGELLSYDENIKYGWSKIPHFIMQDTYYLYQYVVGTSIATYIAYKILNNDDNMKNKYIEFLTIGNKLNIKESLEILGIDLNNECYINGSINILKEKIEQLKNMFI